MAIFKGSFSGRIATLAAAGGLLACNGQVSSASAGGDADGSGGEAAAGSGGSGATTVTAGGSGGGGNGSGGGGDGGSGGLPEPECVGGEGAIVFASGYGKSRLAVRFGGSWSDAAGPGPAAQAAARVDEWGRLSVFWTGLGADQDKSHTTYTEDGSAFESVDVQGWAPLSYGPLFALSDRTLAGGVAEGTSVAHLDADAWEWVQNAPPTPFKATWGAQRPDDNRAMLVGLDDNHQLCTTWLGGQDWAPLKCRPDIKVPTGGEIPNTRPRAVALPNGDMAVVFYTQAAGALAITRFYHGDALWSEPDPIEDSRIGIQFAVTAAASGDVIVATTSTAGDVSALRYSFGDGWSEPIPIDQGAAVAGSGNGSIAAAPGICGDDALIAYLGNEIDTKVHVARVRGQTAATQVVTQLSQEGPSLVTIATRLPPVINP